jgi:hypothetical protein
MIRWLARKAGWGCYCCGSLSNPMWRRGDHAFAVVTMCVPCKFGACEDCA